ncbi:MAG: pyridoxamine 5'-phosphate oxidase family protein [Polyangiaceae bacterium]
MTENMDPRAQLIDILKSFDTAMLLSESHGGLHARPMAIADVQDDGKMFFVTDAASPKLAEIDAEPKVYVTAQGKMKFIALTGYARILVDPARVAELWKEAWKVWFPKGEADPSIRLIEVSPVDAEYWDSSGTEGLKYAFEAAKAYLKGERAPAGDKAQHDRVRMS